MPTFYRIVHSDPPTVDDFLSDREAGEPEPEPPNERLWDGMPVYSRADIARRLVQRVRRKFGAENMLLGEYLAELQVPDDGSILYQRTLPERKAHFTILG